MDDMEWQDMDEGPSAAEIATCAAVLRQMNHADLLLPEFTAVREAGVPVFKRLILKERFGSEEVLDFLKEKTDVYNMKVKLERLHKVVTDEHETRRIKAETCGMNTARKEALAAIKAESLLPDDTLPLSITEGSGPAISGYREQILEERTVREAAGEKVGIDVESMAGAHRDALYMQCNMCRGEYLEHHHFYHQLCPRCAEHNWEKRHQTADMSGMVCVVTGGRIRIGYVIVLKLLRAGAFVLTTTRFPYDCALRFSREPDYETWKDRLEVCGPFELCDMRLVERFCEQLVKRFPRIHVLINNAAQTLTRQEGWNARMAELECSAADSLPSQCKALLRPPTHLEVIREASDAICQVSPSEMVPLPHANVMWQEAGQLMDFPEGKLDESRQPLDLSAQNSWSRRLGDVSTLELLQTLAANTAAPFIMCSKLACVLAPKNEDEPYGHVINVSALEGKFSVKNKSSGHPHTNMAKAGLNMMTHTSSKDMFQRRILMNCVDTGWVTDMAPGGVGAVAASHATWVGPPLDEDDGAARVLDPVFSHLLDQTWLLRGKFFKNYYVCGW